MVMDLIGASGHRDYPQEGIVFSARSEFAGLGTGLLQINDGFEADHIDHGLQIGQSVISRHSGRAGSRMIAGREERLGWGLRSLSARPPAVAIGGYNSLPHVDHCERLVHAGSDGLDLIAPHPKSPNTVRIRQ